MAMPRDTKEVLALRFPTFAYGSYGQDSAPRYKVYDFRVPIEMGGVRIRPGDILFGDIDGVLVVPVEAEVEVFTRALEKARGEKAVKRELERGKRGGSVCAARNYVSWMVAMPARDKAYSATGPLLCVRHPESQRKVPSPIRR
jgi:regulator of RNase E activity RraA